jgi:hypothetical protein
VWGVAVAHAVVLASSWRFQLIDQTEDRLAGKVRASNPQGFQVITLKLKGYEKGSSACSLPHAAHSGRCQSLVARLRLDHGENVTYWYAEM